MKILYVTTIGSTMGFFKSLIKELLDVGHIVDIATNEESSKVQDCYREWGCKIYPISTSRSPFNLGNIKAMKQIRNIAKNYDIVHCHTPLAGMATRFGCRKLRKKQGLKVIYTAHGFHFYKGAPKKNWLIYYPIEKTCSKWTDVLITINKEDYEFAKKKMKAKKIEYVHGVGVDINKFAKIVVEKDLKRDEIGVPRDSILILSVGELNDNKNHQVVIKAISRIENSNIYYCIVGIGEKRDYLLNLASSMGVKLVLLGRRTDVPEILKASDIFVFPSIREGLGLAAIEAIASGLPLICSDNRGTREYCENQIVVKSYDDVIGYSEAIKKAIHVIESGSVTNNNIHLFKFDSSEINKKIKSIYKTILS